MAKKLAVMAGRYESLDTYYTRDIIRGRLKRASLENFFFQWKLVFSSPFFLGTTKILDQYFMVKKLAVMADRHDSLDTYYTREINRGR